MEINATAILTVQIGGGPAISVPWTIAADAFDRATVKVPAATNKLDIPLQPGGGDKIQLLLVTASKYGVQVTYKLGTGTASFDLDGPHIVAGSDLVNELNSKPSTIAFKNAGNEDVTVDVVVLRVA